MHCAKCGKKIPKDSSFCRFCGHQLVAITELKTNRERTQLSRKAIAAGTGAVIILLSLAFPWYDLRLSGASFNSNLFASNISFIDLITGASNGGPAWVGSALPVIAVITFASFTLLTVIYNLVEDVEDTKDAKFWSLLGIISAGCIIFNAVYLLFWMYYRSGEWVNLVNPGIVIAFIGAVIMVFSCALPPRVTSTVKS
ncbi:zinc-ribbon domain-containing protein [Chloroflexota bacterium]